jgi:hypothetical protein
MAPTVGKVERSEADIAPPPFGSAVIKRLHGSVVSHYPLAPYEHRQAAVQDRLRCCEIRGASRELISRRCRQLARFVHPETKLEKKGPLTPAVLQQMSAEQDELLRAHAGALEQAKVVPGRPE